MKIYNNASILKRGNLQKSVYKIKILIDRLLQTYDNSDWLLQRKARTLFLCNLISLVIIFFDLVVTSILVGRLAPEFLSNLTISTGLIILFFPLIKGRYHLASGWAIIVILSGLTWTRFAGTGYFSSDVSYDFIQYVLDLIIVISYANIIAHRRLIINLTIILSLIFLGIYTFALPTLFHTTISQTSISVFIGGYLFLIIAGVLSIFTYLQNRKAVDIANKESVASKESEKRLTSFMNSALDSFYLLDPDLNFVEINKKGLEIIGKKREDVLGKNIAEIVPDVKTSGRYDKHIEVMKTGKPFLIDHFIHHPVFGDLHLVLNSFKVGEGLGVIAHDITERKQSEVALRESEERFRAIVEGIPDALFITAQDGHFIEVNNAACKQLNYTREELLKMMVFEIVLPDERQNASRRIKNLGDEKGIFETQHVRKDGTSVPVELSLVKLMVSGKPALAGVARDITERKQAEDALRTSELQYRELWEATVEGIVIHDKSIILEVNEAMCNMFGYKHDEVIGRTLFDFAPVDVHKSLREFLALGKEGPFEIPGLHAEGSILILEVFPKQIFYKGKSVRMVAARDITVRKRAEEVMKRYQLLSQNTSDIILFIRENDGQIVEANEAAVQAYGYDCEEILKKNISELRAPETINELSIQLHEANLSGIFFETLHHHRDGSVFPVEVNSRGMTVGNERILLSIIRDISERKQSEKALRLSEEKFSKAFHISPDSVNINRLKDGLFIDINDGFTQLTGYTQEDINGKTSLEINIWDKPGERAKLVQNLQEKGKVTNLEASFRFKNGAVKTGLMSASIIDINNEPCILSITRDITERKRSEEAVRASEEKFKRLVQNSNDIITVTDENCIIISISSSAESSIGYKPEELSGLNGFDFIHPEDRDRTIQVFSEALVNPGIAYKIEYRFRHKDGTWLFMDTIGTNWLQDPVVKGIVLNTRDVTERKKNEIELEKYRLHLEDLIKERTQKLEVVNNLLQEEIHKQKEAEEKVKESLAKEKEFSELKSKFISIASHEFRTPLSIIYSSTELLQRYGRKWDDNQYNEQTERVKDNVLHMTEIMDDVLTISRAETGKIKFEPKETDLEQLCHSIMDDLKLILTKKHKLEFNYLLRKKYYLLDEKLLKYILLNLMSNAIKYSVEGGRIEFNIRSNDNNNLVFEIKDEGIGIPEKDQIYLFEPFHRGENVGDIQGTGLGMSIIKRSVDIHNGSISFISKVNFGTTFSVKIPI